ncbi:hypothetical protein DSM104443_04278 [Usitatibacter rugosus]|uniref:LTXXQ motif family protein n=1 Tax=Usitatibacter rugosus TaxID=2732067 RepID=A0A6M4H3B0_9PROT|nr:hypothetical protein [Usitatibacter rugosus]QJR13183.1 hypothetical protein DSM104443_04278 [Usitatibacter rugosus]
MNKMLAALASLALAMSVLPASAQYRKGGGSRSGGDRPPGAESSGSSYYKSSASITDPMAALERELPSLRMDLLITKEQGAPWDSFERAVRDIAELGRARQRHQTAPAESGMPPPPALNLIRGWADDDRNRSDAMNELVQKVDALQAAMTETQRKEFDRRIVLSQTEPLNAPPPSPDGQGRRSR